MASLVFASLVFASAARPTDERQERLASVNSRLAALHRARDEALQPQAAPITLVQEALAAPKEEKWETAVRVPAHRQLLRGEKLAFILERFQLSNMTSGLDQHVFCGLATAANIDGSSLDGSTALANAVCELCALTMSLPAHCPGSLAKKGWLRARMVCAETEIEHMPSSLTDPALDEFKQAFEKEHKLDKGGCHRWLKVDSDSLSACFVVSSLANAKLALKLIEGVSVLSTKSPVAHLHFADTTLVTFDHVPEADAVECEGVARHRRLQDRLTYGKLLRAETKGATCDLYRAFAAAGGELADIAATCSISALPSPLPLAHASSMANALPVPSPVPSPASAPKGKRGTSYTVEVKMACPFSLDFFSETTEKELECHVARLASDPASVSCDDVHLTVTGIGSGTAKASELSLDKDDIAATALRAGASASVTLEFEINVLDRQTSGDVAKSLSSRLGSADAANAELHVKVSSTPLILEMGQRVNVIIISDRLEPLAAAIGSIVLNTDSRLHVYVIAQSVDDLQQRLTKSIPLKDGQVVEVRSMANVTSDLLAAGIDPVWTWQSYGQSVSPDEGTSWSTDATVQQEMWDHDLMHASPFNHLRFYLPHLPFLANLENLLFLDDDVILQKDIALLASVKLPEGTVLAAPCDTWVWGNGCSHFEFVPDAKDWRNNSAVLYLNPAWRTCGSPEECGIAEYEERIQHMARKIHGTEIALEEQPVWNFGAVLVSGSEWLRLNMTGVYHEWLRENYERRLWREDSLAYGLGIPYLAFAGKVTCWNELLPDLHFRDGLGFVSVADLAVNNIDVNDYITDSIVLHWSGRRKPWGSNNFLESAFRKPWEDTVRRLGLSEFIVAPMVPPPRKKAIFFTEPRSGSEWFMDLLDHHPQVCATGDRNNPTAGFGREALMPEHYSGSGCGFRFPTCSVRLSCNWAFFAKWVPHYHFNFANWCESGSGILDEDTHATHGPRLCDTALALSTRYPDVTHFFDSVGVQKLWDTYEDHAFRDDSAIVPCSCQHKEVQMFKAMRSWFGDTADVRDKYPESSWYSGNFDSHVEQCGAEVAAPKIDWSQYHVVEFVREDVLAECVDILYSDDSPVDHISTSESDVGNIADAWHNESSFVVNATEITDCVTATYRARNATNALKAAHKLNGSMWLTLSYEECVHDHAPCLEKVVKLLGVDPFGSRMQFDFEAGLAEAARKHNVRMLRIREMRRAMGETPATSAQLAALASGMSDSTYSGHSHAWAPATALASRAAGALRAENRQLRSLLEERQATVNELENEHALTDTPCEGCSHLSVSVNPYSSSSNPSRQARDAMVEQRDEERERSHSKRSVALQGPDHAASSCAGAGSLPTELLLEGRKPSLEECGTQWQTQRGHLTTTGGTDFEAPDVFAGIRNTVELQMALINEGLGETTRPIYYFACDEASGGLEMANYLFELPNQYIVPGSHRACGPFDFTAFRAAAEDVAARKHPVIAMGDSRTDQFLFNLWGGSGGDAKLSERLVVVIGVVRDVLEHRIIKYATSEAGSQDFEEWLKSSPREQQLRPLLNLNATWENMMIRNAWDDMQTTSLTSITRADSYGSGEAVAPPPKTTPSGGVAPPSAHARVGIFGMHTDPKASLCVLAKTSGLPIPWKNYSKYPHESITFDAVNQTLNERIVKDLATNDHREFLMVALATDRFYALATNLGCVGESESLAQTTEANVAAALASVPANGEPAAATAQAELGRVGLAVDRLGNSVLPIGPEERPPCRKPYTDEFAKEDCHPIFVASEQPLYYFMHTPKTAGTTVSKMLMRMPGKWLVPGSQPSEDFNFTEFMQHAADVAQRDHAVVAFSHLPPHLWIWKARGLERFGGTPKQDAIMYALTRRPVIVIGLLRDTLTQRLSYFDDFVRPRYLRQHYHPTITPHADMLSWAKAPSQTFDGAWGGDYPEALQFRPFFSLLFNSGNNSAWKAADMNEAYEQMHVMVSGTGGSLGFVGLHSNVAASMCVLARTTRLPIPWNEISDEESRSIVKERFVQDRPAEMLKSFNDTTAAAILSRDAREVLFIALTKARFQELASSVGCIPAGTAGTAAALSVSKLRAPKPSAAFALPSPGLAVAPLPVSQLAAEAADAPARFMIVSMAHSGGTFLESLLNQHPEITSWAEIVRVHAGEGVAGSVTKAWKVLEQFATMPAGGTQDASEVAKAKAKRLQGFRWLNGHGGLDLRWYPPRNTTERFGPWLREHNVKLIFLERKSSIDMQLANYRHDRSLARHQVDLNTSELSLNDRMSVDVPHLMQGLNDIDRVWKEYARWATENLEPANLLHLTYDQLRDTPQEAVNRVFDHLGVPHVGVDLSAATGKMGVACTRDGLSNPDAVAFALVGTKWEGEVGDCIASPPQPPSSPPPPPWHPPLVDEESWLLSATGTNTSPNPRPQAETALTEQVLEVFARAKDERRKDMSGALAELAEARAQFAQAEEHLAQARVGEQILKQEQVEAFGSLAPNEVS